MKEQACERLLRQEQQQILQYRTEFVTQLRRDGRRLKQTILEMLSQAARQMEGKQKETAVYFHFSLLKVDLLDHRYTVVLQVQDDSWYLDQEPVEVQADVSFLFAALEQLWEHLSNNARAFFGKVDQYDVFHMICDELEYYSSSTANLLRYLLRGIEQEPVFQSIPREDFWMIRWGEYESDSEIVIQQDRQPKTAADWEQSLLKLNILPQWLAGSYWYQCQLTDDQLQNRSMPFITFDQAVLRSVGFDGSNLIGAQFIQTRLIGCSFRDADMRDADFTRCSFVNVDVTAANVTGAIFSRTAVSELRFSEQQLAGIFIRGDE